MTQLTSLPSLTPLLPQLSLFSKPRLLCISLFPSLKSFGLIYKSSSGYLQKRMKKKKKNTRGQENKESPTQFLVPQDSLNQKLWVKSSMLYFTKSSK